jgi:dipeptide/tripeptide permease
VHKSGDLIPPIAEPAKTTPTPFPRVFWVALLLELIERAAFYGVYINLAVYLTETVGLTDKENGALLGVFAMVRAWVPVATGALADRIGFRRSLAISFGLYAVAYGLLYAFPSRPGAWVAVLGMAVGGAFLKPVIPATVRRHAPEERRTVGFSMFYSSVNAGSVIGKLLTKLVRELLGLRASILNAVVACVIGLGIALTSYREPALPKAKDAPPPPPPTNPLSDVLHAVRQGELMLFILLISGYYLLIEQFYQTFPSYIVRSGHGQHREIITLINPASIAVLGVFVGGFTKRLRPATSIALGVLVASGSMFLMGSVPTLAGACGSFFIFAVAEMILSPRYYELISSYAPKGREGLYMGLSIVPAGIGGLAGGFLSGSLIDKYLPKGGPLEPLQVWGRYAAIGLVCAALLGTYAVYINRRHPPAPAA